MSEVSQEFVNTIKKYVEMDDQIKSSMKALKVVKTQKKELGKAIMNYMNQNSMKDKYINIGTGKLKCVTTSRACAITRKHIENRLKEYFKNEEKALKVTEFIYENRTKTQSTALRRSKNRNT
jgi:hypothetical protein